MLIFGKYEMIRKEKFCKYDKISNKIILINICNANKFKEKFCQKIKKNM